MLNLLFLFIYSFILFVVLIHLHYVNFFFFIHNFILFVVLIHLHYVKFIFYFICSFNSFTLRWN
jgi:hypothetical protein